MARVRALVARRRTLLVLVAVAVLAAVIFAAVPRQSADSPEAAIYALAHAVEHKDTEGACARLIDVAALAAATSKQRGCGAAPDEVVFADPLVYSVQDLADFRGAQAACAKVAFEGGRPLSVLLVKPAGRWRVLRVRGSSLTAARSC